LGCCICVSFVPSFEAILEHVTCLPTNVTGGWLAFI
jgi:hypothetical protein